MEKLTVCPLCQSQDIVTILKSKDHFLSKESFDVDRCSACLICFTNPRPSSEDLLKYYESDGYISHGTKSDSLFDRLYETVRNLTIRWKVNLINQISDKDSVLDYGCGTGDFLKAAYQNQWTIHGIEPSDSARKTAENNTAHKISKNLNELPAKKYKIITLWHVLEHVTDVKEILFQMKQLLKEEGRLIIAVPNHESYDAKNFGEYWAAYDLPRHLWHFDKKTLTNILSKASLQVEAVIPMKLDAYYISILSNNYKYGKSAINMLRAFKDGTLSNFKARKENNYSSLIYIAKSK